MSVRAWEDVGMEERIVQLQIRMLRPPVGVQWCLQRGSSDLVSPAIGTGKDLTFECEVRARLAADGGGVRFLGPFTQGPPKARFIYLCAGTSAGQHGSVWTRRAKIPLAGITWDMCSRPGAKLVAEFEGTAKDGGPACATVKFPQAGGWRAAL